MWRQKLSGCALLQVKKRQGEEMSIPMVRSNFCINCNPQGCKNHVKKDIECVISHKKSMCQSPYATEHTVSNLQHNPKNVLVIGSSSGYGLATRIVAAFGYDCNTVGVSYERAESEKKQGTPGWYHNRAFEEEASHLDTKHITIEGDAFSQIIKNTVVKVAKEMNIQFDLVIYSIASHQRKDEATDTVYQSCIKPFGNAFVGKTINVMSYELKDVSIPPATQEEIEGTIKVMGGEDWKLWMRCLKEASLLSHGGLSIAYSYIGSALTAPIYKDGTIGLAKKDLEATTLTLNEELASLSYRTFIACMKGIATRSSAIIPSLPLYLSALFKVMKEKECHEGAIEQVMRLFGEKLTGRHAVVTDSSGLIRLDDAELQDDVQSEVERLMQEAIKTGSLEALDVAGYKSEFLSASGF